MNLAGFGLEQGVRQVRLVKLLLAGFGFGLGLGPLVLDPGDLSLGDRQEKSNLSRFALPWIVGLRLAWVSGVWVIAISLARSGVAGDGMGRSFLERGESSGFNRYTNRKRLPASQHATAL